MLDFANVTSSGSIADGNGYVYSGPYNGSVQILRNDPAQIVEGMALEFEAGNLTGGGGLTTPPAGTLWDNEAHEIEFSWSIQGSPFQPFTKPANLIDGWGDPNKAFGKKVFLWFPDAGTYTVNCEAIWPDGTRAVTSTSVVVQAFSSVFSGTNILAVAKDGVFTGAPAGAQTASTFAQIASITQAATAPLAVLFKAGEDWGDAELGGINQFGQGPNGAGYMNWLGKWGAGADPLFNCRKSGNIFRLRNNHSTTFLVIENLDFRGTWDDVNEVGMPGDSPIYFLENTVSTQITIANCNFEGLVWVKTTPTSSATTGSMAFVNNRVGSWQDYGVYHESQENGKSAFIGCQFDRSPDAADGNPATNPANAGSRYVNQHNEHGAMRFDGEANHIYMYGVSGLTKGGHSNLGSDTSEQPFVRVNQGAKFGGEFSSTQCVLEGGAEVLKLTPINSGTAESPGNYVIDMCLLISTSKSWRGSVALGYGGTTIRNTYGFLPNAPHHAAIGFDEFVRAYEEGSGSINNNLASPVRVYNCAMLNNRDAANDPGATLVAVSNEIGFTALTEENNLVLGPAMDTPVVSHTNVGLSETISGATCKWGGIYYKEFNAVWGNDTPGNILNNGTMTIPYPAGADQTTMQALVGIDDKHAISIGNIDSSQGDNRSDLSRTKYAELAEFSLTFNASDITLTNTSGEDWNYGVDNYFFMLDRSSQKSAVDASFASPPVIPVPVPGAGSTALNPGSGLRSVRDFFGNETGPNRDVGPAQVTA